MIYEFDLMTLDKLDNGKVLEAWRLALHSCIQDCDSRPGVGGPRKVLLELSISPKLSDEGTVDTVTGIFQVKDSVPQRKSDKYDLGVRRLEGQNVLVFNDMSEDNVLQKTIDEVEQEEE